MRGHRIQLDENWSIVVKDQAVMEKVYLRHTCRWKASEFPPPSSGRWPKDMMCKKNEEELYYCDECDVVSDQHVTDIATLAGCTWF